MTSALKEIKGVRQVLKKKSIENQPALILEYLEGETLRDYIKEHTHDLKSKFEIAIQLARILEKIHQKNIIHLDFNSKNIIIGNDVKAVNLIDFGSASRIDSTGSQKVRPDQMLGTLPYISPEQTGRINRSVDERSDLYSLGVVLYELFSGKLPFDSINPVELIHQHITLTPVSPSELIPEVPNVVSNIILKLLSKDAENRYQSAAGAKFDLEKCLQRLTPDNKLEEFHIGEADYSSRFKFPQKLYGRESDLNELTAAYKNVSIEKPSIFFIAGNSGIGKTALVGELQRPVSEKNGYFIEGKFDQLVATPYAGISQGLDLFISQILTQSETRLSAWRSEILEALGPNGRVLTNIVPRLELVIGPQPAVPELSGQEAQNRFNYVFQSFFGAIANSEHPICFFLDDLQWIDPGSLGLLKALFTSPDLAHLLVIGAYRDNEVHEDHPLMLLIADLEKAGTNLKRMTLPKLAEADLEALISDTLRCDPVETTELARLIYSQTDGNPFFTRQVLSNLEDQDLLVLDTTVGNWRCDMDALKDLDLTASVVELLEGKLKELPVAVRETLKVAACIGNRFDFTILNVVAAADEKTILDHVHEAVTAGLIWERDDLGFFVHDRVQEAAYAQLPPEDRDRFHLMIGRLMLKKYHASDHEQVLYKIVDQLNHGLHLLEDEQERIQIARLNLQAARAARQASAFETGLNYAQAGIELLGENSWDQDYQLTLALHEQAALMAHAAGDIPGMEQHSEQVLQHARDSLDLAKVQGMRLIFLSASNRLKEALDLGLESLRILGQEFPADPDWELVAAKVAELHDRIERENPDFLSMPPLHDQDPQLAAISEIFTGIAAATYITSPALCVLIFVRLLDLCVTRRLLPACSPWVIVVQGIYVSALLGKVEAAHKYGETSVRLAEGESFRTFMPSALYNLGTFVHFWRYPLRETLDLFTRGIEISHDYGDNQFIAYLTAIWSGHAFWASIPLDKVVEQSTQLRDFLDAFHNDVQRRWLNIFVTAAQALRGGTLACGASWRGTPFDDDRDLPNMDQSGDRQGLLYAYCTKAWVATLFGDHSTVEKCIDLAQYNLKTGAGLLENAIVPFICGLQYARELRGDPDRPETEQDLEEQLDLLERFAGLAPTNFAHKLSLVQAEVHRARGEVLPAMQAYEQAGQGARENGYLNEAGLAYALAAEFFQDLGLQQAAIHNAEQAAQAWKDWGADALVENLSRRLPGLLGPSDLSWQSSSDAGKIQATITQPVTPLQLDMDTIISSSQMLSAEIDLEQLLTKMTALVMANSGAEKAVLLLKQENDWFVQARGDSSGEKYGILLNQPLDLTGGETDFIPESIFNYCRRSKEVLVVGNAKLDQRFSQDRTIQKHDVLSLACIPVLSQGNLKAMVYLENCQLADVFTPERQQVIKHLSTQFGISVENAMLYDRLNSKKRELEVSETRFRSLVENAEEAIVVSQDNMVKYANEKFKELSGYSVAANKELGFRKFIHPDDLNTVLSEYQARVSGEKPTSSYAIRIISKQGQTKYAYVNSALIDWDGKPAALALITDITQLKKVESDLRISEERYELAVSGSDAGIWDYSISTGEIYYSDRFKELMGYEPHEMNDHTPEQSWNNLHPDFREIAPLKLKQHLEKQTPYYHIEYLVRTKSGEYRWFQSRGKAVWDENGNPIRVAGSFVDIHDRKKTEEEVRQAYDEIKSLKVQLEAERAHLQDEIKLNHNFESIIGESESLKYVLNRVEHVAPTDSPVLIMGETGTGKELMARAIHDLSPRQSRVLIKVNCAALPRELIESELFGHEKGAFTGAVSSRQGRFEVANGSSLFLDEIGEMPLELQAKLLRVLESGEYERLGSSKTLRSDARIIVATNRVLEEEVKKGRFREDLWYRMKVFPITVPPLRERLEDLPLLVKWLIDKLSRRMGKSVSGISKATMKKLQSYPWPGNVRELEHVVENSLITSSGGKLNFDIPIVEEKISGKFKSLEDMERDYLLDVLKAHDWRIGGKNGAVNTLQVPISTLRGRMTKLGIKKPKAE